MKRDKTDIAYTVGIVVMIIIMITIKRKPTCFNRWMNF